VSNWVNWGLVIGGVVLIIAELLLGAVTGFDLALIGISISAGGAVGLAFESTKVGFFSAGALAFIYLAFFRRWLRSKLRVREQPSNVDAIVGSTGVVILRIAPQDPGQVKVGDEIWRAELARPTDPARDPGERVIVEGVEVHRALERRAGERARPGQPDPAGRYRCGACRAASYIHTLLPAQVMPGYGDSDAERAVVESAGERGKNEIRGGGLSRLEL
jgi:membrane protein implicated in regulation of membrane protease activity